LEEVGAYQAVFQPGRSPRDALVFGSVHTNIGHLDGRAAAHIARHVIQRRINSRFLS
jgi:acyl transferase domain-containing protein